MEESGKEVMQGMKLYEPVNVLKPVGEDIWVVDGPFVTMSFFGMSIPYPTRMVVVRLKSGELFLWSPTELVTGLRSQIDALGPVRHLVSPNKLHYVHIAAWKAAYPQVTAWASPGVRARATSHHLEISFDRNLGDYPDEAWREDLNQLIFRGSRFMEEVAFFHRKTRTLILADMIENFEPKKVRWFSRWLVRLGGVSDPDGKTPIDWRLTFVGHKKKARSCLKRILAWHPEKVIVAHGRWYDREGTKELRRAFRWLGSM